MSRIVCASLLAFSGVLILPAQTKRNPKDDLTYIWIQPGLFAMGCSPGDAACYDWEDASHEFRIGNGFWIGQTEVTQSAYAKVMGANPSLYKGPNLPVEQVSWINARRYCEAVGMRLPTEAEWEYAARGGTTGALYDTVDLIAWYDRNAQDRTHPVAEKKPNAFGLYDMLGNVWEWVENSYAADGRQRILRGGSFYNLARDLRVSNRLWALPETDHRNMGVRCAGN
jgi:formylglycine-generating enzyme required for sulfatase activity